MEDICVISWRLVIFWWRSFPGVIDYEIKLSEDEFTAIIINGRVIFLSFQRAPGINASNHNPKIVAQPHFAIIAYTDDIMYCLIRHLKDIFRALRPRQWIIPWNERNSSSRNGTLITIPKLNRSHFKQVASYASLNPSFRTCLLSELAFEDNLMTSHDWANRLRVDILVRVLFFVQKIFWVVNDYFTYQF